MIDYRTRDWLGVAFRVHGTVLPRIAGRTLLVGALALALCYLREEQAVDLAISGTAHAMVGLALGLLLVFRTNASYDRYWEGRKLLGGLVNNCRDLSRQLSSYLAGAPPETRRRAGLYVIALYALIRHYLRREREWPELAELLGEAELAELESTRAPPLRVARWLSELLAREADAGRLPEERLRLIDGGISDCIDLWGGAERILKTPVPFAYAHHIKGFLTIFCFTTPLALLSSMGWYTPVAAAVIAYGLFGIDEIGVEIEDPFGYDPNDLPLDAIGEVIDRDVRDTIGNPDPGSTNRA